MTVKVETDCAEKSDRLGSLRDELDKKKKSLEMQRRNYQERREMYLKINALLLVRRSVFPSSHTERFRPSVHYELIMLRH